MDKDPLDIMIDRYNEPPLKKSSTFIIKFNISKILELFKKLKKVNCKEK